MQPRRRGCGWGGGVAFSLAKTHAPFPCSCVCEPRRLRRRSLVRLRSRTRHGGGDVRGRADRARRAYPEPPIGVRAAGAGQRAEHSPAGCGCRPGWALSGFRKTAARGREPSAVSFPWKPRPGSRAWGIYLSHLQLDACYICLLKIFIYFKLLLSRQLSHPC